MISTFDSNGGDYGEGRFDLIAMSEKKSASVSRDELVEILTAVDEITLQLQRLTHKISRISLRLGDPTNDEIQDDEGIEKRCEHLKIKT